MMLNKTIIVTGASQRIGLYLVNFFLEKNYRVGVIVRNKSQSLNITNKNFFIIEKDLSKEILNLEFWSNFLKTEQPVFSFVHCASTFIEDNPQSTSFENLTLQQNINCNAFIHACSSYYQIAKINKLPMSSFISLIDQKVENVTPEYFSYTLSKLQLANSIKFLAQTLAPNIRVNGISPGLTLPSGGQNQEEFDSIREKFILGYGNDCIDIAETINFLNNQKSIIGQIITVDAGQHLS